MVAEAAVPHRRAMQPPLLVFIGPSGTGKSSIVRELDARAVVRVHPTWTSRPRRREEADAAIEHHFVSEREFLARRSAGGFLHSVQMFGLPHWYGLPPIEWSEDGRVDCVMLRAPLVDALRAVYRELRVYQVEAPRSLVAARLDARDCGGRERRARLRDNTRELEAGAQIADRRFCNNQPLPAVVDDIQRAVRRDFARFSLEAR
jgi:guanylate kinase